MSFLKLTYCHLIKIILSQIGGNPLQQIYSQLTNGVPTIAPRTGLIPSGLSQVIAGLYISVTSENFRPGLYCSTRILLPCGRLLEGHIWTSCTGFVERQTLWEGCNGLRKIAKSRAYAGLRACKRLHCRVGDARAASRHRTLGLSAHSARESGRVPDVSSR
jgi:hypothetical protein